MPLMHGSSTKCSFKSLHKRERFDEGTITKDPDTKQEFTSKIRRFILSCRLNANSSRFLRFDHLFEIPEGAVLHFAPRLPITTLAVSNRTARSRTSDRCLI